MCLKTHRDVLEVLHSSKYCMRLHTRSIACDFCAQCRQVWFCFRCLHFKQCTFSVKSERFFYCFHDTPVVQLHVFFTTQQWCTYTCEYNVLATMFVYVCFLLSAACVMTQWKKREHACVCGCKCFPHNSVTAHGFTCLDNMCKEAHRWDSELSIILPKCDVHRRWRCKVTRGKSVVISRLRR